MLDEPQAFPDFVRRIRAGDQQAAAELVRRYERLIRIEVRRHLHDPSLNPYFDSLDICQSVLASFFVRAAAGQFDLDDPRQLLKLLVRMTQNKLVSQVRKHRSRRRDSRRRESDSAALRGAAETGPGPEQAVAGKDLLEEVRRRLTDAERRLVDRRAE